MTQEEFNLNQDKWDVLWLNIYPTLKEIGFYVSEGDFLGSGGIIKIEFGTRDRDNYPLDVKHTVGERFRAKNNKKNREKVLSIIKEIHPKVKEYKLSIYLDTNTLVEIKYWVEL